MSEPNRQFQFGQNQLLVATVLLSVYFALMHSARASLESALLGAVFLAARYPCVAFAHRWFSTIPLLIFGLVIPAVIQFDVFAHQWNTPKSRWTSGDWLALLIGYSAFPIGVFLLDALTAKSRTNRQNWIRFAIELVVILPAWGFISVACSVRLGSIP